ncbi:hypothetical protein, partial [Gordonia sp. GAMMA]|uniref:hypothetical protein n=1 Tax=Gordonia sp. GAMMA TaxID=2502241 RepID=UPI001BB1C80A
SGCLVGGPTAGRVVALLGAEVDEDGRVRGPGPPMPATAVPRPWRGGPGVAAWSRPPPWLPR